MKVPSKIAAAAATLALGAVPAVALANGPGNHGKSGSAPGHTKTTHGNSGTTSSKAKAYGRACLAAGESKKHVKGMKGTPFSNCVVAMAQLAKHKGENPAKACAGESKTHVKGMKGTPFSDCVSAAAKLRGKGHGGTTTTTTTSSTTTSSTTSTTDTTTTDTTTTGTTTS